MIDLHTHSSASDGTDSPETVVALAAAAGLSAVALTDHDTTAGVPEAAGAAERLGVRLVPAVELSCARPAGDDSTMHLLVYFVGHGPGPLQDRLAELRDARDDRNVKIVAALRGHGVDISIGEVLAEASARPGRSVGRPHIASVMARKGYVADIQDAFDRWLAKGQPAYVARRLLPPATAIELAHRSGGVTVLAHPETLGSVDAVEPAIADLAALGLDGIEAEYGRYTRAQRDALHALAARHGLCVTGGSDYHGTNKTNLAVGTGTGDLAVPDAYLTALEARRP